MGSSRAVRIARAGWNPWAELARRDEIEFGIEDLGPGVDAVSCPFPSRSVILIDASLDQVHRNAALAHELVHLERDWPCRAGWAEEERVHDEVARRLVPLPVLHQWVVSRELDEAQVEVWHVAEAFHVPDGVAGRALRLLVEKIRGDIGRTSVVPQSW